MSDIVESVGYPPENPATEQEMALVHSWTGIVLLLLGGAVMGFLLCLMFKDKNKAKVASLTKDKQALRGQVTSANQGRDAAEEKLKSFNEQADKVAQMNAVGAEQALARDRDKDAEINTLKKQLEAKMSDNGSLQKKVDKLTDELSKAHLSNNQLADDLENAGKAPDSKDMKDLELFRKRWEQTSSNWKKTINRKVKKAG